MLVILVILFTVKLYAQINIFNVIKKKHGQEMLNHKEFRRTYCKTSQNKTGHRLYYKM